MQDKVVVGSQDDALRGLTRFSDNEGDIIWPAWRAELKQRVAFEFGKIGNQIIEGEVKESDTANGEVTVNIHALINALIPKTRAQIQTRSDWMEEIASSSAEAADVEGGSTSVTFFLFYFLFILFNRNSIHHSVRSCFILMAQPVT